MIRTANLIGLVIPPTAESSSQISRLLLEVSSNYLIVSHVRSRACRRQKIDHHEGPSSLVIPQAQTHL